MRTQYGLIFVACFTERLVRIPRLNYRPMVSTASVLRPPSSVLRPPSSVLRLLVHIHSAAMTVRCRGFLFRILNDGSLGRDQQRCNRRCIL